MKFFACQACLDLQLIASTEPQSPQTSFTQFIEWTFTVFGPGTQHGTTFQVCARNCLLLVPRACVPDVLAPLLKRRPNSVATGDWPLAWTVALAMLIAARSLDPSSTLAAG